MVRPGLENEKDIPMMQFYMFYSTGHDVEIISILLKMTVRRPGQV
jgi:hypothetical protein